VPIPEKLRPALRSIVDELVKGNYAALERDGRAGRVGAEGLQRAITEYRRHLVDLPEEAFAISDAYERKNQPGTWTVALNLWTAEEGRSDLTLSATVNEVGDDVKVEIDDLHVL
jgi:RecB family endonuclease NucS